jgi:hypothetical protein
LPPSRAYFWIEATERPALLFLEDGAGDRVDTEECEEDGIAANVKIKAANIYMASSGQGLDWRRDEYRCQGVGDGLTTRLGINRLRRTLVARRSADQVRLRESD